MSLYLSCLAVIDTLTLLLVLLPDWLNHIGLDIRHIMILNDAACKVAMFQGHFLRHLGSWIIVHLTFERLASVIFLFHCKTCSIAHAIDLQLCTE